MKLRLLSCALLMTGALTVQAQHVMDVNTKKLGATVQSTMYGLFFEDINFAADGGLYGELVKKHKEYFVGDQYDADYIFDGEQRANASGYYLLPTRIGVSVSYMLW